MSAINVDGGSTTQEVADYFANEIQGKHVIVNGATTGLGKEISRVLASHGAIVTLASQTRRSGNELAAEIRKEFPQAKLSVLQLDLKSLPDVKWAAESFLARKEPLNVLINNAGMMQCDLTYTEDGLETLGVHHVGNFLFTKLLLDRLAASGTPDHPSRVVNLASAGQYPGTKEESPEVHDVKAEQHGTCKMATILFTEELNRRMRKKGKPVIAVSVHPGAILGTDSKKHPGLKDTINFLFSTRSLNAIPNLGTRKPKVTSQASARSLMAAFDPNIIPGKHYTGPGQEEGVVRDDEMAKNLWRVTSEIVSSFAG